MKMKQKQYAICTNDAVTFSDLNKVKTAAGDKLSQNPEKTIFICEVIGTVSSGVLWDMKRTRKTRITIPVDSQKETQGGGTQ